MKSSIHRKIDVTQFLGWWTDNINALKENYTIYILKIGTSQSSPIDKITEIDAKDPDITSNTTKPINPLELNSNKFTKIAETSSNLLNNENIDGINSTTISKNHKLSISLTNKIETNDLADTDLFRTSKSKNIEATSLISDRPEKKSNELQNLSGNPSIEENVFENIKTDRTFSEMSFKNVQKV